MLNRRSRATRQCRDALTILQLAPGTARHRTAMASNAILIKAGAARQVA